MKKGSVEEYTESFRRFLRGGAKERNYIILDPSSYAAEFVGKSGGYATFDDNIAFHAAFPNDCPIISVNIFPDEIIPELRWRRLFLREKEGGKFYEETINTPDGIKRRIIAEQQGTTPWLVESAVKTEGDFSLIDYYADCVKANSAQIADSVVESVTFCKKKGHMVGAVLLIPFEAYYLIKYPDMPIFYYDFPERYLSSIRKVHAANIVLARDLARVGCEVFYMGSAGLELLSPKIFDEAIIPFAREITEYIRSLGAFSVYHICGFSRQLLKSGRINAINPTWFETFSTYPCGDNNSLKESLEFLDPYIISKGNLPLDLLRNGTHEQIQDAVHEITEQSEGRRHILGQADGTILSGTPHENIRTFLLHAKSVIANVQDMTKDIMIV